MTFKRNFTYWIDKRGWKYVFLLATLELSRWWRASAYVRQRLYTHFRL